MAPPVSRDRQGPKYLNDLYPLFAESTPVKHSGGLVELR
jgi:hypothetical protein